MNTLYFFKARDAKWETIVFLFTAKDEAEAVMTGVSMIADFCRNDYTAHPITVEAVCQTPDEVLCYEPV